MSEPGIADELRQAAANIRAVPPCGAEKHEDCDCELSEAMAARLDELVEYYEIAGTSVESADAYFWLGVAHGINNVSPGTPS